VFRLVPRRHRRVESSREFIVRCLECLDDGGRRDHETQLRRAQPALGGFLAGGIERVE
jgi:hypothetical protein